MSLPLEQCEECGKKHRVCPACGSSSVTAFDPVDPEHPLSWTPMDFLYEAEPGADETATFRHDCWECGWREEVTIRVE